MLDRDDVLKDTMRVWPEKIVRAEAVRFVELAGRGAAEARGGKLRFALAQEGCSLECLDGEADVWHDQLGHSSLRSSLPSCALHPKHGDPVLSESNFLSMSPMKLFQVGKLLVHCNCMHNCTGMF